MSESTSHLWKVIQSWLDGQMLRTNQSQLADAIGVPRQSLSQWKKGQARPAPENLRALRRVTRIDWNLLTDALLRDMGYVEEDPKDGTATTRAGARPAHEDPGLPQGAVALAAYDEDRETPHDSQESQPRPDGD